MISYKVKSYLRQSEIASKEDAKLNILVIGATHERYEQQLCMTGHNFYSVKHDKEWNLNYGEIPKNYTFLEYMPYDIHPDLIISHVSGERLDIAIQYANLYGVNVVRHTHTLPESEQELFYFRSQDNPLVTNTFISEYSKKAWGSQGIVINHGLDLNLFKPKQMNRELKILSVVNQWADRDWACGWEIYKNIRSSTNYNYTVLGDNPGMSKPATSIDNLVDSYNSHSIFLNTSMQSPVPMALLEAMACGCAVVSTATCMIPEIIKDGYNGFLCSDVDEIKDRLQVLHEDPQLAIKLGDNARKTMAERFGLENFCINWNNIFRKVILNEVNYC